MSTCVIDVDSKVVEIYGKNVLLDSDVADLYGVETKEINQAVKNNQDKFPDGYIITLDKSTKSQVVKNFDHLTLLKYSNAPIKAFTEKGLSYLGIITLDCSTTLPFCIFTT